MKKTAGRAGLMVIIIAAFIAFFMLDLESLLTLENIKASQAQFEVFYEQNRLMVVLLYMGLYILVTALSLPGAAAMSLLGGALLGFWVGVVAVSFASTIGATLACAASRFIFRDWVQGRFGSKLVTINHGIEREGGFYLFTLRLIPIFPFFVINILMGLTRMSLRRFYWVSQLGMLPVSAIFVNAGKELGQINSLSGIVSPELLGSFALLGLFPLFARHMLSRYRSRHGMEGVPHDENEDNIAEESRHSDG